MNWEAFVEGLGDEATAALKGLVDGAQEDLKTYGKAIAKDMVAAVRDNRPEIQSELREQLKVLAEIHRIRLVGTTWDFVVERLFQLVKVARLALLSAGVTI